MEFEFNGKTFEPKITAMGNRLAKKAVGSLQEASGDLQEMLDYLMVASLSQYGLSLGKIQELQDVVFGEKEGVEPQYTRTEVLTALQEKYTAFFG